MVLLDAPSTGCSGSSVVAAADLQDAAKRALLCPQKAPCLQPALIAGLVPPSTESQSMFGQNLVTLRVDSELLFL